MLVFCGNASRLTSDPSRGFHRVRDDIDLELFT